MSECAGCFQLRKAVIVILVGSSAKGSRKALPRIADLSVPGTSSLLVSNLSHSCSTCFGCAPAGSLPALSPLQHTLERFTFCLRALCNAREKPACPANKHRLKVRRSLACPEGLSLGRLEPVCSCSRAPPFRQTVLGTVCALLRRGGRMVASLHRGGLEDAPRVACPSFPLALQVLVLDSILEKALLQTVSHMVETSCLWTPSLTGI